MNAPMFATQLAQPSRAISPDARFHPGAHFTPGGPLPERSALREAIAHATRLPEAQALAPLLAAAPQPVKDALSASVPFPKRLGQPEEYAKLAMAMIENGYFNGEDVRLDGAIRMAPR